MKHQYGQIMESPGHTIPIPDTYLHSSGIESIPKTFLRDIEEYWLSDDLGAVSCPVHILHPELDELCPVEGSQALQNAIGSNCELQILENASHSMSTDTDLQRWREQLIHLYSSK